MKKPTIKDLKSTIRKLKREISKLKTKNDLFSIDKQLAEKREYLKWLHS